MFSTNTGSMRGKTSASKMDWKDQQRYHQLQANLDNKEIHPNITHGYAGLRNQGATCYLNTVLQILFMTEEFRKAVESSPEKDDIPIGCALAQLFKDLESRTKIVTTEKITDALKIADVSEQQDAAKLFLKILNMVSPDMSKTFQGIMEYITICKNPEIEQNHSIMEQIDSFFSIGISMESQPSINVERCFKALFEPVFMVNEDQLYCTTCKSMMDMETNCKITKCPSVLVLHLKRFELDYNTMYYRKNTSEVEIPLHLLVKSVEDHKYDLYAVVKHEGSLRSGHYYADIKSCEDQKWYRFNDSSVQEIGDLENLHCNKAYLLLYKSAGVAEDTSLLLNESETPGQGNSVNNNQNPVEEKMACKSENPQAMNPDLPNVPPGPALQPQNVNSSQKPKTKLIVYIHDECTVTNRLKLLLYNGVQVFLCDVSSVKSFTKVDQYSRPPGDRSL